jgi:two-component system response regulator PilR (NtrC family)
MAMTQRRVLVADDETSMREMLEMLLRGEDYEVDLAADGKEAIDLLTGKHYDVVLTDLNMPQANGIEVLEACIRSSPSTQILLLTAFGTDQSALIAMAEGAFGYLEKPFKVEDIRFQVRRAMKMHDLLSENIRMNSSRPMSKHLSSIIGRSPAINEAYSIIKTVAPSRTTVLITGESGTGKELAARALHAHGTRPDGPFVVVNCGAIPENLMESELFGYEKGAFTGATHRKVGLFTTANGGTLFLDEVGELPLQMQVKLLRVIQERCLIPVGGLKEEELDIRFVAGTNRDLEQAVREQKFREDLYYRLNVVQVRMPSLRDRRGDIPLLAGHFLRNFSIELGRDIRAMDRETLDVLMDYPYGGNVRELENIIERAVTFETSDILTLESLPPNVFRGRQLGATPVSSDLSIPAEGMDLEEVLAGVERKILCEALQRTRGNQTDAARLLGITFRAIRYKISKYGIDPDHPNLADS